MTFPVRSVARIFTSATQNISVAVATFASPKAAARSLRAVSCPRLALERRYVCSHDHLLVPHVSLGRGCLAVGVSAHQQVVSTILQCPDRTATTICETGGRPQSLLHRHESRSAFPPPLGNGGHQRVQPRTEVARAVSLHEWPSMSHSSAGLHRAGGAAWGSGRGHFWRKGC